MPAREDEAQQVRYSPKAHRGLRRARCRCGEIRAWKDQERRGKRHKSNSSLGASVPTPPHVRNTWQPVSVEKPQTQMICPEGAGLCREEPRPPPGGLRPGKAARSLALKTYQKVRTVPPGVRVLVPRAQIEDGQPRIATSLRKSSMFKKNNKTHPPRKENPSSHHWRWAGADNAAPPPAEMPSKPTLNDRADRGRFGTCWDTDAAVSS